MTHLLFTLTTLFHSLAAAPLTAQEQRDLELFQSRLETPGLIKKLDRTHSQRAQTALKNLLINPISSVDELRQRQSTIATLAANPELHAELDALFKAIELHAQKMNFSYDTITQKTVNEFYFQHERFVSLNKSPAWLTALFTGQIAGLCAPVVEHAFFHYLASKELKKRLGVTCCDHHHDGHKHNHKKVHAHDDHCKPHAAAEFAYTAYNFAHWTIHLMGLKTLIEHVLKKMSIVSTLFDEVQVVKNYLDLVHRVSQRVAAEPVLAAHFSQIVAFDQSPLAALRKQLAALPAYSLNPLTIGKILKLHQEIRGSENHLEDSLKLLAHLDLFVGLATLFRSGEFCFPTYSKSTQPEIELIQAWHPFLDSSMKCIDLHLSPGKQHLLITGANGSGKSTVLKTATTAVVLAQTCAIVPAQSMHLTPFEHIITSFILPDNLAAGLSLFAYELDHAQQVVALAQEQKKIFVASDELFRSTHPEVGVQTALNFLKALSARPGVISLTATHFHRLAELKQSYPTLLCQKMSEGFQVHEGVSSAESTLDLLTKEQYSFN